MNSGDLPAALLQRKAVVYVRQSSPNQVINNPGNYSPGLGSRMKKS